MAETTTPTLTDFLLARIAEDEATVHEIAVRRPGPHVLAVPLPEWPLHRVLAECEAKRRIVAEHKNGPTGWSELDGEPVRYCTHCHRETPCPTVRLLALPYANHPGYREEWRP